MVGFVGPGYQGNRPHWYRGPKTTPVLLLDSQEPLAQNSLVTVGKHFCDLIFQHRHEASALLRRFIGEKNRLFQDVRPNLALMYLA